MKDIRTIKNYVKVANNMGQPDHEGLKAAATHFGVTLNSVNLRWKRFNAGVHMDGLKGNTTKEPMNRKNRKYTKKSIGDAIIDDGGISKVKRKYTKRTLKFKEDKSPVAAAFAKRIIAESNRLVFPLALLAAHVPKITAITVDFDTRSITYTY